MPYTSSLGEWLTELDLKGTESLHTFNSHREGGALRGQAFTILRNVSFHYHAHCCQLRRSNYSYYKRDFGIVDRKREALASQNIFQKLYDYFLDGLLRYSPPVAPDDYVKDRYARQTIPDENVMVDSSTCLNYTDLNIVLFPTTTETLSESGSGEMNNDTGLPEGWLFHPNSTDLICTDKEIVNITTHVYQPCADESSSSIIPSHTVSALPTPSPTPTALQTDTLPAASPLPTVFPVTSSVPVSSSDITACSVEVFCMLTTVTTTTPPPTPPPCECVGDYDCVDCRDTNCELSYCEDYQPICAMNCFDVKRRRRYTTTDEKESKMRRDASDALLPNGWFYPNPNNMSFICIPTNESIPTDLPTTTTPMPSTSTAITATPDPRSPVCLAKPFSQDGTVKLLELLTFCSPPEDPFNPCEDLLGEDNVLRSFIWIVIILALVGNSLVIMVFLGYSVITKRTKVELFVVHFFYFNLAIADFLMGIYLFTIAVQDLRTLGNFSMFDIAWRTEGGCDFAGFCAITSTMVSVYTLLVITVERLYTFSRALQNSHTSKTTGIILMAVGWAFGILMGILPIVGVSDYTRTAICLPFDVSSTRFALPYILFLLLFTGIVFTAIAICYVIIFYQVFYHQKTTINSASDRRRWKIELKVALRMGTLVLSNFVCWFPIAVLGISAAVGNSLVNNITFAKWVMVFIFPINACLNPILYSALSKTFRDNLVLIFDKCGLCRHQASKINRHRAGFTPSIISTRSQVSSEAGLTSESRRGTIIEQFRNFSITSTTSLLGRRSSTMSQTSSEEHYQIELIRAQRRRSSEYSSASSEDILGLKVNSRRGSAFSGGSIEEMTTFSNPGFRSSSPVGGSTSVIDGVGNHKGSPRPRISLGAVLEENENSLSEIAVAPELNGEDEQNLAYLEHETEVTSANKDKNVYLNHSSNGAVTTLSQVVNHHRVVDSESEIGSGSIEEKDSRAHSVTTDLTDSVGTQGGDNVIGTSHEVISIEFD